MTVSDKCIVRGCKNHKHEGAFIGDLCSPCYLMLTSGDPKYGSTFVHNMRDRIEELEERLKAAQDDAKEAEAYALELEAKLAKAKWLLVDATVQLEEGKIKTRRNRAALIRQFLAELTGDQHD